MTPDSDAAHMLIGGLHMHLDGAMLRAQLLQEAIWALRAAEDEFGVYDTSIAFCI
jgi:hypothetical protein